jgi:signal recognition particle subunit SRP14
MSVPSTLLAFFLRNTDPLHTVTPDNTSPASPPPTTTDSEPLKPAPILIRATDGQSKEDRATKVKISTLVQPDDLDTFYTRYADVCRTGMTTLKPRDRTKRKKNKKKKVGGGGGAGQTSMRAIE